MTKDKALALVNKIERDGEAALRQPTQSDALREGDAQTILYLLGVRRGREDERAKIVAWLMREEDDYPSGKYSVFAAIIREEIEAGEHLK